MRLKTLTTSLCSLALAVSVSATAYAEIVAEPHVYQVGEMNFKGYVAYNENLPATRGTVLIVHDWDGLTEYEMRRAEMLAAQGYTAFAIDVYGEGRLPTSLEENRARSGEMYSNRSAFQQRLQGALDEVTNIAGGTDDVVVIGYCFGGAGVLELARTGAETEGYVSFHGGLGLPDGQNYNNVAAPVMLQHGSADPVSGMSDLAALIDDLQAAGVEHSAQIHGGARHAFTVHGSGDYDLEADQASWHALLGFLSERLD
ncbi:dienelactone hydrolase family protein [Saccharospirillum salsuginis]|uniref:Dienelactone hydrolase n=1 Tax=Saccharospirillum salsuginis TaxID=418750 RepID=A0A918N7B0_9GAMM|nr:dienelactone hydrolase family protein [Saccharospirillum salsuginis]GGX42800.1 dienelactone hydrolase [Saccharospirillum salsuginis]